MHRYKLAIRKFLNIILHQPSYVKAWLAAIIDLNFCALSVWISYYLRLGNLVSLFDKGLNALVMSILLSLPLFYILGLYKSILRFSGLNALIKVYRAFVIYGLLYSVIIVVFGVKDIPRTIGLIQPLIFFIFVTSWRVYVKYLLLGSNNNDQNHSYKTRSRALVYGAGKAGRQLVRAMQDSLEIEIKGFLDDDKYQQGRNIDGKIIYKPKAIGKLINKENINLILLALPSVAKERRLEIIKDLVNYKIAVRSIPGISDMAQGKSLITDFNEIGMDELLGRVQVKPFTEIMRNNIYLKTILVTGAGGSIGSELCRQILKFNPKEIILVEISEYALYKIHDELIQINHKLKIIPLIASVQDYKRMDEIMDIWKPETIYHAAAYKHVPIVEHNLVEGFKNNVLGTYHLANLAIKHSVDKFVFISTDKAVRPTNIMGATKRFAELILQALNHSNESRDQDKFITKFSIVRFGNVLDSSGSVIPKFRDQIKNGGPITLTDKKVTRYFMTIKEASQLVIQAGAISKGGDVFVLDMGEPIKIYDLASKMIELSGLSIKDSFNKKGDIEIVVTGLRPGEKLCEELLLSDRPTKTIHPKIFRSQEPFIKLVELNKEIELIQGFINKNDLINILKKFEQLISGFTPNKKILDHTFKKNK